MRKKSRKLDVCRTGIVLTDQLISATWREDKEPTILPAERLPGDAVRDQLISATWREEKEPTLLSAERLPGDTVRDQLISTTWREDKEPTLLSAERLPGDVARDQLISSVRPASPMTAEKPGNKASTQLSAGQLVSEEAAVAASCAYQSPAMWKPGEARSFDSQAIFIF